MIYIHAVRMSAGGSNHEHIANVRWKNPDTDKSGESTVATIVDWIKNENGKAYACGGGGHMAAVRVVAASPPYIRTKADGVLTDNLLKLPRY